MGWERRGGRRWECEERGVVDEDVVDMVEMSVMDEMGVIDNDEMI